MTRNNFKSWRLVYWLRQLLTFLIDTSPEVLQLLRPRAILIQAHLVLRGRRHLPLASLDDARFIIIRPSQVTDGDIWRRGLQKLTLVNVALAHRFLHLIARRRLQQIPQINCWCLHRVLHSECFDWHSVGLCYVVLWLHDWVAAFSSLVCCRIDEQLIT